jgi:Skp family chaperone for outer membrane proteins
MKKALLVSNIVLALAVSYLYYLHFSSPTSRFTSATNDTSGVSGEPVLSDSLMALMPDSMVNTGNIAFINFDELTKGYKFYSDGVKALEADFTQKQTELATRQKKWEDEVKRYQQLAANMNDETRAAREKQLMEEEKSLYEFRDNLEGSFAGKQEKFNKDFLTKIDGYFKNLSKQKNYDYIFVYSKGGPSYIVYANESLNITNVTIAGLNSQYKK